MRFRFRKRPGEIEMSSAATRISTLRASQGLSSAGGRLFREEGFVSAQEGLYRPNVVAGQWRVLVRTHLCVIMRSGANFFAKFMWGRRRSRVGLRSISAAKGGRFQNLASIQFFSSGCKHSGTQTSFMWGKRDVREAQGVGKGNQHGQDCYNPAIKVGHPGG